MNNEEKILAMLEQANTRLDGVISHLDELKAGQAELKEDTTELKKTVAELKAGAAELKAGQDKHTDLLLKAVNAIVSMDSVYSDKL